MKTLRSRLYVGALLWTIGLFCVTVVLLTEVHSTWGTIRILHAHAPIATVVAIVSMIGGFAIVRRGVSTFDGMRRQLSSVRSGTTASIDGAYPLEVQPLVDDLNALLAHQQRAIARATAKAGDLAHGLKTPLAVLTHEADRAEAAGAAGTASVIRQQVERMRGHVEYHLAHARAAASGATPGARASLLEAADAIARTLRQLYADRRLAIDVEVPPDCAAAVRVEDLEEMLGNLLDNACKWARRGVRLAGRREGDRVHVTVEDDGPGIEPGVRASVLRRGVRADEASPGSGLGLAIVRDLAELHGGNITLESSALGGLRARLDLPAANPTL